MIRSRFGPLGLCAVLLGVMAFGTTSAQATEGAHWWILNSTGTVKTDAGSLTASLNLEVDLPPIVHSKIAGIAVLYECTGISLVSAALLANGSVGEKAGVLKNTKIRLTGCITKLNGAMVASCEPRNAGTEKGVIATKPGHGLIVLYVLKNEKGEEIGRHELIQMLPDEGETLAVLEFGPECVIGSKIPIIGKLFFKDCENKFKVHLVKHLIEVGPLTEIWTISKTAEHIATILGGAWAFLQGPHVGLKWAGEAA